MTATMDVILEKNLSSLTPFQVSKTRLRVDRKTVFIVVPDTTVTFHSVVKDLGIMLTTCKGIVSPNKALTISNRKFNGRLLNLDLKKKMAEAKGGKKLRVLSTIPKEKNTGKAIAGKKKETNDFYFYDMSVYTKALRYMDEKFSEKMTATRFFDELIKT